MRKFPSVDENSSSPAESAHPRGSPKRFYVQFAFLRLFLTVFGLFFCVFFCCFFASHFSSLLWHPLERRRRRGLPKEGNMANRAQSRWGVPARQCFWGSKCPTPMLAYRNPQGCGLPCKEAWWGSQGFLGTQMIERGCHLLGWGPVCVIARQWESPAGHCGGRAEPGTVAVEGAPWTPADTPLVDIPPPSQRCTHRFPGYSDG